MSKKWRVESGEWRETNASALALLPLFAGLASLVPNPSPLAPTFLACPLFATNRYPLQRISGSGIGVRESWGRPAVASIGYVDAAREEANSCKKSIPVLDLWLAASMGMPAARRVSTCVAAAVRLIVTLCVVVRLSILHAAGAGHRLQTRGQRLRAEGGRLEVCFAESLISSRGAVLVRGAGEQADRAGDGCRPGPQRRRECEVCGVKCAVAD